MASVDGPGIDSARSNRSAFSSRQKYCERNNSCRQTTCAPFLAASRILARAFSRFSCGIVEQDICTSPMRNGLSEREGIGTLSAQKGRLIIGPRDRPL